MNALLATVGSLGDFHPLLSVGQALRASGVNVFLISHPYYQEKTLAAGLQFIGAGQPVDLFAEIKKNPQFITSRSAPVSVWNEFVLPAVEDFYRVTIKAIEKYQPVFLAAHFLSVGSLLAAYQAGLPKAVLMTTPTGWLSSADISLGGWSILGFSRPLFQHLRERIFLHCSYSLEGFCEKLNITWHPQIAERCLRQVELNLGLWSPHFRPATGDDPPHSVICGFCHSDGDNFLLPGEIEDFLQSGPPPVIVTFGSAASLHAGDLYQQAAEVCRSLSLRCLLVGPELEKLSSAPYILTWDYLPYPTIFPRCSLIIHHGGINTVGQALKAGRPQIILPFCHDQFDNAARCVRLGVALRLDRYRLSGLALTKAVTRAMKDKGMAEKALNSSRIIHQEPDGSQVCASNLLSLVPQS